MHQGDGEVGISKEKELLEVQLGLPSEGKFVACQFQKEVSVLLGVKPLEPPQIPLASVGEVGRNVELEVTDQGHSLVPNELSPGHEVRRLF